MPLHLTIQSSETMTVTGPRGAFSISGSVVGLPGFPVTPLFRLSQGPDSLLDICDSFSSTEQSLVRYRQEWQFARCDGDRMLLTRAVCHRYVVRVCGPRRENGVECVEILNGRLDIRDAKSSELSASPSGPISTQSAHVPPGPRLVNVRSPISISSI